jgi:hypothetical protein
VRFCLIFFFFFSQRQKLISHYDLEAVPGGEYSFKQLFAQQRLEFLRYFFLFCQQTQPLQKQKKKKDARGPTHGKSKRRNAWSKWLASKTSVQDDETTEPEYANRLQFF